MNFGWGVPLYQLALTKRYSCLQPRLISCAVKRRACLPGGKSNEGIYTLSLQSNHRKLPAYGQVGVECLVDVAKIYVAAEGAADEFANVAEFRYIDRHIAARILTGTSEISWEDLLGR